MGARGWDDLMGACELRVRDTLARFRGQEIKLTGDGVLAAFDGAARALRCSDALREIGNGVGLSTRSIVHTG